MAKGYNNIPNYNAINDLEERKNKLIQILNSEKTKIFNKIPKGYEQVIKRQSTMNLFNLPGRNFTSVFNFNNQLTSSLYQGLSEIKLNRLRELRRIADSSEMTIALRKIADEFLNEDRECKFIRIQVKNKPDDVIDILRKEFYNFIDLFKLRENGWNYCKEFLIDGEKFFENLVSIESPELGIVGINEIPPERIEPMYKNRQNDEIDYFVNNINPSFGADNGPTNQVIANQMTGLEKNYINLDAEQITYVHSAEWCPQKISRKSHISNALRDYRVHYLMEDTNLIYITARAPERLLFEIPVDNLPDDMAQEHLRRQAAEFNSQQSINSNGIAAYHNPQSQLENYYVGTNNGVGVKISSIGGTTQLEGRLELIKYFTSKLYQALQIPTNRLNPETNYSDGSTITAEEVEFGKMIERLQNRFAFAIKKTFITHLKLKGKDVKGLKDFLNLKYNIPANDGKVNLTEYKKLQERVEEDIEKYKYFLNEEKKKYEDELFLLTENSHIAQQIAHNADLERIRAEIQKIEMKLINISLKSQSIWDQYDLDENDIELVFNAPNAYNQLKKQQQLSIKIDNISSMMNIPFMSVAYALKYADRFDGGPMTNYEINELYELAIAEAKLKGQLERIAAGGDAGDGGNPLTSGLDGMGGDLGNADSTIGGDDPIPPAVMPNQADLDKFTPGDEDSGGSTPDTGEPSNRPIPPPPK